MEPVEKGGGHLHQLSFSIHIFLVVFSKFKNVKTDKDLNFYYYHSSSLLLRKNLSYVGFGLKIFDKDTTVL